MKHMPQVQKFMTPMPHTVGIDIPLKTAMGLMREYNVRHLPVQDAGHLVGILTDRDIKLASSFQDAANFKVVEVMSPEPYTVAPEVPLDRVVIEMAAHKYGCAIVKQPNGKIVGIFTAVDGLRVLGELLKTNYKEG
jgi:acetoin utilization protein AcuB